MQKYVRIVDIKDMKSSTKEKIYQRLLSGHRYNLIAQATGKGFAFDFDVECFHNDLQLSSWTLNFWCRTHKAIQAQRYKSFSIAMYQLRKLGKKYGLTIDSVTLMKPYVNRPDKGIVKIYL